jgi:hypothetical protein
MMQNFYFFLQKIVDVFISAFMYLQVDYPLNSSKKRLLCGFITSIFQQILRNTYVRFVLSCGTVA